tara:strand:+ start:3991 stop:5700 length:1710 start_codon:yes stop_codon:yes gene_type:complete
MKSFISFIKSSLKEINPWQNIKILHTNIRGDILSGITVAIIALPLALAFGEISQLGPEAGIWSAVVGGIIGGLFGGCIVGVSGPTAPMASQIAAFMGAFVIGSSNEPDLIAAFSIIFLSGLILVAISMLKISRFIHYIPYSAIAGFMCGIGLIIIFSQINPFLGLESKRNIYDVFNNFQYTLQNINVDALYVSLPSLFIVLLWPFLENRFKFLSNIPSPLIALITGTSIAYFLNLDIHYIGDKMNGSEGSEIFTFYLPDLTRFSQFIMPAFLLAGLAIIDSLLSCKVADNMTGTHHSSDRETFGQGLANMFAGLLGGISTATATTQTVGNVTFGAKTPLATIVKGLVMLSVLFGLGHIVATIPTACLAAILFKLGIDILDYRILPILRKIPITDLLIFIIVLLITVFQNLMIAVIVGFIFACIRFFKEIKLTWNSNLSHKIIPFSESDFSFEKDQNNELKNLPINVLEPHGPLFFGSVEPLRNIYAKSSKHEVLIIDMSYITMIDLSGIYTIEDIINIAKTKNIQVFVTNTKNNIKKTLEKVDFIKNVGDDYQSSKSSIKSIILNRYNF